MLKNVEDFGAEERVKKIVDTSENVPLQQIYFPFRGRQHFKLQPSIFSHSPTLLCRSIQKWLENDVIYQR